MSPVVLHGGSFIQVLSGSAAILASSSLSGVSSGLIFGDSACSAALVGNANARASRQEWTKIVFIAPPPASPGDGRSSVHWLRRRTPAPGQPPPPARTP